MQYLEGKSFRVERRHGLYVYVGLVYVYYVVCSEFARSMHATKGLFCACSIYLPFPLSSHVRVCDIYVGGLLRYFQDRFV